MKPTNIYEFTVPANGTYRLLVAGDYFKLLATTGALTVRGEWGKLQQLNSGQGLEESPFGFLLFEDETGAPNTVRVVVGDTKFLDGVTGSVTVSGIASVSMGQGAYTQAQKTVTNASTQMLAANAARRYMLVQNKDAAGVVYVNLAGATATTANGLRLLPGESLEIQGYAPTAAVTAIGSIASNANVVAVEG